jgi:hypothetical protein
MGDRVKVFLERQNALVICKVKETDKWLFTSCYEGSVVLLEQEFPPGTKFEFDLKATNIKRLN